jgi:plasmid stabilization system protein ParE
MIAIVFPEVRLIRHECSLQSRHESCVEPFLGFSRVSHFPFRFEEEEGMPRGDKSKYSNKQKRKAEHIAESYEDRGVAAGEAKRRAWATVNKESGGGNLSGGGRGVPDTHVSSKRGGKKGGAAAAARPAAGRSAAAKKAAATRKRNKRKGKA